MGIYPQERGPSIPYFREELLGLILKGLVPYRLDYVRTLCSACG